MIPVQVQAAVGAGGGVLVATPPEVAQPATPAAVVGLETDEPEEGAALTRALRRAFAARGLSGGKEVNLSELRLALGCKTRAPACLARGGAMLDARRLIYGTLHRAKGGGWTLEATLLEVEGGTTTQASMTLTDADIEGPRIDATASAIADRLAPDTVVSAPPEHGSHGLVTPPPPPPPEASPRPADDDIDDDGLRWGWVKPQPRWKWVGFGVSAGLFAVSAASTVGMSVWLVSREGGFRTKLLEAAEASLTDSNPLNDVDPNMSAGIDLCEYAGQHPDAGQPGQVRNVSVVQVCRQGDDVRRATLGTGIATGVSLAATLTFGVLLFVRRGPAKSGADARAWRRHGLAVGLGPARGQGLSLRLGGRF